jgi:hypothetical protein
MKIYTYNEKKAINNSIEKLKINNDKKSLTHIAKLIVDSYDIKKITTKSNGMWLDFNDVSNLTVYKIDKHLKKLERDTETETETDNKYIISPNIDENIGPKLSNYEKNLIKYRQYNNEPTHIEIINSDKDISVI